MLRMNFTIPGKTLSANDLYRHTRTGVYLSPEAKDYKKNAAYFVKEAYPPKQYRGGPLRLVLEVVDDWFTKDGKVRRIDADNLIKLVQDAIFQNLDIDDSMVFDARVKKIQNKKVLPHVVVKITEFQQGKIARVD